MTNNPVRPVLCGGHPGSPGVMPKDGDEGSTRWLCEGCPDCNPAPLCVVHVPDAGRCLHDADDHAAAWCSMCNDEHAFTPPAEAALGRVEGLVGALRRTDSALAAPPGDATTKEGE